MSLLVGKKILLAISGGIAAYKTTFLTRLFIKEGATVKIVMTPSSIDFVSPLTLSTLSKNKVEYEFVENNNWNNHVELALWADIMVIAPATAKTLSRLANGGCDNLLIATYLSSTCPVYIAPAMDLDMYTHFSTTQNLGVLARNGNHIIPAEEGGLASGLDGKGRMAEPENIVSFIKNQLEKEADFYGKTVLISAGPTHEYIDPVRFLGNSSSGKMGYEIAKACYKRGAKTILVSGPSHESLDGYNGIELEKVISADEMHSAMQKHFHSADIVIMSAAVADYKPSKKENKKIKKKDTTLEIILEKNIDILYSLGLQKKHQYLVGFALETDNEEENANKKLIKKNLDAIVLNSLQDKGAGFQLDTNKISIISKNKEKTEFPLKSKTEVATDILNFIKLDLKND